MSPIDFSAPPPSRKAGHRSRHIAQLSNLPIIGRSVWVARVQQVAAQAPPDVSFPGPKAFLQVEKWLIPYLRNFFHKNAPYQSYSAGQTGIFKLAAADNGPLRIAIASDWATGTMEANRVANNMKACHPHYTLHLGDVYHMGEAPEIEENCFGKQRGNYHGVNWPMDCLGSFALMGNHEMYSGGHSYFKTFLPKLGLFDADKKVISPQSASFFCLETDRWVILGLDTGYHAGGIPALSDIPGINSIPFLNVNARFDDIMMRWLKQTLLTLRAGSPERKPVLVLTHHQPFSSFEQCFGKPVEQLAEAGFSDGREFVWLFGHEHRLTIYNKQRLAGSMTAYPRCVGHAGMPVKVTKLTRPNPDILYYDPRVHPIDDRDLKTMVGYNGHVVLLFEDEKLTIEYHDIERADVLLTETFTPGQSGTLQHSIVSVAENAFVPGSTPSAGNGI
jgi:hypothetical protein